MRLHIVIPILLFLTLCCSCFTRMKPNTLEAQIQTTFKQLKCIRMMKPGKEYSLIVGGCLEEGTKEQFLRRRNAAEIWQSRLSSGCGDYSIAFIERMSAYGADALMIDAAELSRRSLESRFAGHSVVAVRTDSAESVWWLVDPSARKILSQDWDIDSPLFEANGKKFWIGFCGPIEEYPVDNPLALKDFYDQTLRNVPQELLKPIADETKSTASP